MICPKPLTTVVNRPIHWLWKPFLPFGKVTLIQGETGRGKTTLLVKIMADLSRGIYPPTVYQGALLSPCRGEPVKSFYATVENDMSDTVAPQFDIFGGDRGNVFFQDETQGHFILNGAEIDECVRMTGARLIVIDPWQQFLDNASSSDNNALRSMICDAQAAAERTGAAVVLAGNFTKSLGTDIKRGIGGAELMNTLRCVLTLQDDPEGDPTTKILIPTKMSLLGKDSTPVIVHQNDDMQLVFSTDCEQTDIDPAAFLHDILSNGPLDSNAVRKMAEEVGIGASVLYRNREKANVIIEKQPDKSSLWRLRK
ncbi:MAG: AAA family ATPase [Acidaminococcaceae bacterium]|nr:AAA family ATPase [Acidaminococcaceae bacterium]